MKGDEPKHDFGYLSLISDPLDLTTWSPMELHVLLICIINGYWLVKLNTVLYFCI